MRSSARWRQLHNDSTVDIFGNKKRGGGGDRVKEGPYSTLTSNANTNILSNMASHAPAASGRVKSQDELFREELALQVEEQRRIKHFKKLQDQAKEREAQEKVEREMALLRLQHSEEIRNENSNAPDNAGFLRFSNSHSHIPAKAVEPPKVTVVPKAAVAAEVPSMQSIQQPLHSLSLAQLQALNIENMAPAVAVPTMAAPVVAPPRSTEAMLAQMRKLMAAQQPTLRMNPINPTMAAMDAAQAGFVAQQKQQSMDELRRQICEQELELKRIRLQMLEQQNDQKTTLQYLLRLQTDFTEQIHSNSNHNAAALRRPLSSLTANQQSARNSTMPLPHANAQTAHGVHSSMGTVPTAPRTPEVCQPMTGYGSMQRDQVPIAPPRPQQAVESSYFPQTQTRAQPRDFKSPPIQTRYSQRLQQRQQMQRQQIQPMPTQSSSRASSSPIQQQMQHPNAQGISQSGISSPNATAMSSPMYVHHRVSPPQPHRRQSSPYYEECNQTTEFAVHSAEAVLVSPPQQKQLSQSKRMEQLFEHKEAEESFIVFESEPELLSKAPVILLRNESSFLVCSGSEDEDDEASDEVKALSTQQPLRSSTVFKKSSRPATAITANLIRDHYKINHKRDACAVPLRSSVSMSPAELKTNHFDAIDDQDTFAVHVVDDDELLSVTAEPDTNERESLDASEHKRQPTATVSANVTAVADSADDDEEENEANEEWKQISQADRNTMESLRDAFDAMEDDVSELCDDEDGDSGVEEAHDSIAERVPVPSPNTSRTRSIFVVKHADGRGDAELEEKKEEDDGDDSDAEYEEDFEPEMANTSKVSVSPPVECEREILRIPDVDASINNFQSKVYSVYSSFDDTLMTLSVASSSDLGTSPRKR